MISVNLQGGLGNQMFQIAAIVALSLRNNDEYGIDINKCFTPNQGNTANKYSNTIFKNIKKIDDFKFENFYREIKFSYDKIPYKKNLLIDGYFQSEKYFEDYKKDIKELFYFSEKNKKKIEDYFSNNNLIDKQITSVHVRRGDYLNFSDFHYVCPLEYYKNSIEKIGDSYFIFISDDLDWVKNNFKSKNYYIPEFNDELLDLTLMTMCDNNIISNSTFSWWGAYIDNKPKQQIISPKKWFADKGHQDYYDVIPNNWLKV